MKWHELIFSESSDWKKTRHVLFWTAWWLYFCICFYLIQSISFTGINPTFVSVGSFVIIKSALLVGIYALACYFFIYHILPNLRDAHYFTCFFSILFMFGCLLAACHLIYWYLFPIVNQWLGKPEPARFRTWYWPAINLGIINAVKVLAIGGTIKYFKSGWVKEQESNRLLIEKSRKEIQSLIAQINPSFLTSTLRLVHEKCLEGSSYASDVLLKLSDLLSYMLYECHAPKIPLSREIEMMKEYMILEKMKLDSGFEMEITISENLPNKYIAPFLFIPIVENGIRHSIRHPDSAWMNMNIFVKGCDLQMTLANGLLPEEKDSYHEGMSLNNLKKRLEVLYPENHELKLIIQEEMMIVQLKLPLEENIPAEELLETAPAHLNL